MKKILFASTALVAFAGAASAEVALSGVAELGVIGSDAYAGTEFHTDIDVTFTMTGEADNGLTFGASIDLDESDEDDAEAAIVPPGTAPRGSNAFAERTQGGESIFVAYGAMRLDMGDVDGAYDAALTEAIIGGSITDDLEHAGYNGNAGLDGTYGGQIATFSYAASGFTGYVSAEIDDQAAGTAQRDAVWGVGVKYSTAISSATVGFGLGYQSAGSVEIMGVSADIKMDNGIQAILNYSDTDGMAADYKHMGIALGYTMNALTVGVNYGKYDFDAGTENTGYGLAVNYDLGGGLVAQAGYGKSDRAGVEADQWSLGLAMSF
ncbi:porin [Tropicibacter naphthalenivorans]|uniref:Porin n=1 Tax=Tropicibacter naphthalenivorans TaxID=441103 RepID=A0A0P1GA45_9RHOB|nr:porin [Tropicibacter naphthalenivorans]CUH78291.1 Porin [Tropicibacter naphthalenivorans]SMC79077.1 outer membrane protein OmpU [Tropicibacter naphthalenivorans]